MAQDAAAGGLPVALVGLIAPYLARQRWYAGEGTPGPVTVVESGRLGAKAGAALLWAIVEAEGSQYQVVIVQRPEDDPAGTAWGHDEALVGTVDGCLYHDATADAEMAPLLLEAASGGVEHALRARPLKAEQSNSSVIYDDRLILKLFRRLSPGPNPDVEVTSALAAAGFEHVAKPLVHWQKGGRDLAFGQQYLAGGTDGWALALTSLRDFYGAARSEEVVEPALSGGDFAAEAARLGQVTAEMHLAMSRAYPMSDELADAWPELVERLASQVREVGPDLFGRAGPLLERLSAVKDPGPSVRAHGDYHLGQVMRTDTGWYVLDFEGEPNRPIEERLRLTSVMRDVAGMLRSFQYASRFVLGERFEGGSDELEARAGAWEQRNSAAFVHGYYEAPGVQALLPPDGHDREAVRVAFELEKALYELDYERSFRPEWAHIPMAALTRLLTLPVEDLLWRPAEPLQGPDFTAGTGA